MSTATATAPGSAPALSPGDFVQVRNLDDKPLDLLWDSKKYRIAPGAQQPIPFEAAKLAFGDPRSGPQMTSIRDFRGVVHWLPDRASEIRRLRCLYDNQAGDESTVLKHPKVEVFDLEGNRVVTVLDDPAGESVTPANQSVSDSNEILALMQRQQATIDMLMKRLHVNESGEEIEPPETPTATATTAPDPTDPTAEEPDHEQLADPFGDLPQDV